MDQGMEETWEEMVAEAIEALSEVAEKLVQITEATHDTLARDAGLDKAAKKMLEAVQNLSHTTLYY